MLFFPKEMLYLLSFTVVIYLYFMSPVLFIYYLFPAFLFWACYVFLAPRPPAPPYFLFSNKSISKCLRIKKGNRKIKNNYG